MGWLMNPIYAVISWILLRWHWVWDAILPNGQFLGTTWDWVLAIVFLVLTVRIILFPVFVKQIRSQRAMQAIAPKVKELQAKHKGDQQTLREEMMKLYQTEKVNPLMGCLPLLLQIPVFFGLFHVLKFLNPTTVDKTQYGWTVDKFDSAVVARLFNAPIPARFADNAAQLAAINSHGPTVKIVAGILVIIMMVTTFLTSRQMILKTGWSQDPQQRMIQKLMLYGIPFSLLLSGWAFPIGVIIYWVTQNLFSLGQQYWVLHKYPPPVTAGNIPMKSASARARDAAATKEPSWFARFIQVKPVEPKAAPATRTGFISPVQDETRTGLLRRKATPAPAPAPAEPRSLAPKPGAKPKLGATPAATGSSATESSGGSSVGSSAGSSSAATGSSPAKRSATASGNGAKANGTGTGGASANGSSSNGASSNGASANGSSSNGSSSSASTSNGSDARPRSTTKKVATTPRKGQPNRKGGAKR
jgi:YidC/Oxa1 family membrane protein insertase